MQYQLFTLGLIIISLSKSKFMNKKKQYENQFNTVITKTLYDNNNSALSSMELGNAGEFSKIPPFHPLITSLKKPHYVEQLHYYEDEARDIQTEAVSIDQDENYYYRPFENKHLILQAKTFYNCESIISPFVCQESSLCGWNNYTGNCYYTNRVIHDIRFKQRQRIIKMKNKNKKF